MIPYFGLRSYQDGGEHYDGQIGAEATPAEFVDALIAATQEMVRVVKPSGSIWVNLGDRYSSQGGGKAEGQYAEKRVAGATWQAKRSGVPGVATKSLIGIPWRYALRCIDDLGLILRAEVIWSKPNGLPESVTDRVRRSHETWFHFVKQPRYYSAVDEVREPDRLSRPQSEWSAQDWQAHRNHVAGRHRDQTSYTAAMNGERTKGSRANPSEGGPGDSSFSRNPLGKLPGSVWTIPTQPLTVPADLGVDHFAAFPMEWPRRIIRGWSPPGVCVECGEGRHPVAVKNAMGRVRGDAGDGGRGDRLPGYDDVVRAEWSENVRRTIIGYSCACSDSTAPTTPAVVLDPFGGTGTTALVAHALGRHGISVDMSADYCRLAEWRTSDPGQLAAAMQVEKPPEPPHGVDSLLDLLEGESE